MKKVLKRILFLIVFITSGSFLFADEYAIPDVDAQYIGTFKIKYRKLYQQLRIFD